MILTLILGVLIAIVAVIFAMQNTDVVTVAFFSLETTQPLAIILLVTIGLGILIMALVSIPGFIKRRSRIATLKKDITKTEKKNESLTIQLTEHQIAKEKQQAALYTKDQVITDLKAEIASLKESLSAPTKTVEASTDTTSEPEKETDEAPDEETPHKSSGKPVY